MSNLNDARKALLRAVPSPNNQSFTLASADLALIQNYFDTQPALIIEMRKLAEAASALLYGTLGDHPGLTFHAATVNMVALREAIRPQSHEFAESHGGRSKNMQAAANGDPNACYAFLGGGLKCQCIACRARHA